jgi:hypothetical protein
MIDVQTMSRRQRHPDIVRPIPNRIIKPIAIKATTIHPRMVKEFEKECDQILPPAVIQTAVEASQEWHRRWTLQEEEGHTMPHDDSWRIEGAKNPSLSNSENEPVEEEEEEGAIDWAAVMRSPVLRPVTRCAVIPSPLLLPAATPEEECEQEDASMIPISRTSSRASLYGASSRASSPLTLTSGRSSVQSGLTGDDESMLHFPATMESYKEAVFYALAISGGDATTDAVQKALEPLVKHYDELGWDARLQHHSSSERVLEGMWLSLSKASFFGSLGENAEGDPMYTLGRMAFDMFLPTQLVCSLQGNFNPVHIVPPEMRPCTEQEIPKNLLEEVEMGTHVLRTYNIVTAFTIEPHMADYPKAPNRDVRRPIKGIMTTFGYVLPDPQVPNRLSIWFTGGEIRPNNDEYDEREWKRLFGEHHHPGRTLGEKTRVLAANLLMGAQVPREMKDDGTLSYNFTRPLGGHGVAYVDVLYLDNSSVPSRES